MADPRMEKWAKALVGYSVDVQPGQVVAVTGHLAAEELLRAVAREVIAKGAHPVVLPILEGVASDLLLHGSDDQLQYISPIDRFIREQADVVINIRAETNTRRMSAVDPARQSLFTSARNELMATYMSRAASGELDWTLTLFPTDAYAQDADMETEAYADFVLSACKLDRDDPVAAWRELRDEQQRLIDWLDGKSEIRLTGPETDLTLSVAGRGWINSDGRRNFPSGEIFTSPVEDSVNGHVHFSFPVVTAGRLIEDIRLRFENGKVVEATAAKNEEYLIQTLDTDPGARYLGEFAFGTNFDIQRFTRNILFDEKIGGTVHMAVGRGYPETGSTNESAIHWDMICDLRQGGQVTVDGELFQKDGSFVI
ncbi:MAG TPA: aminopeptidase [Thermomicrobiales bacterium]|jgi:aminopeptidase|nr:aminopeptidase [Thermomicrobiales bacterium]